MNDKKVVIYSTPTCPYCHRAKEYLTRHAASVHKAGHTLQGTLLDAIIIL